MLLYGLATCVLAAPCRTDCCCPDDLQDVCRTAKQYCLWMRPNILIFSWAVSVWWRILHAQTRRCSLGAAALMLFWLDIRLIAMTLPRRWRCCGDCGMRTIS